MRKRNPRRLAVTCLLATAALTVAVSASATKIVAGNLTIVVDGGVAPKALPKHRMAPVTLNVSGRIHTTDGSHIPALRTLFLKFDKHGTIFTKGLPRCRVGQITNTLTAQARRACGKALVGKGRVTAEVQFPDSNPVPAAGTLLIFNGSRGNKNVLIQHAYVSDPVATTIVTTAPIKRIHGKYGTQTTINIPPISGGYGSLASFTARIHRTWKFKRRKRSLLIAECANGHFFAHGEFKFTGGPSLRGSVVKPCRSKG